jgi:hypothetical protein
MYGRIPRDDSEEEIMSKEIMIKIMVMTEVMKVEEKHGLIDCASLLIAPVPISYPSGISERRQGYPLLVSHTRGFMCLGV